ncbi:MAG: hypothetical protein ACK52I_23125, partial [Pseudomonadota bacterium]
MRPPGAGDSPKAGDRADERSERAAHSHSIVARLSKCLSSLILSQFAMAIYRQIDRQYIPLTEGGRR